MKQVPAPTIDRNGYGRPGWCKACASGLRSEIDRHLSQGESQSAVVRWLAEVGHPISRPAIIRHIRHGSDPKTTFVERARKNPTIKRVSTAEFLQTVVDAGAAKVEENPDAVSIDQALRAAQIVEARKDDSRDTLKILVLALTGQPAPDTINGTFRVLPDPKELTDASADSA